MHSEKYSSFWNWRYRPFVCRHAHFVTFGSLFDWMIQFDLYSNSKVSGMTNEFRRIFIPQVPVAKTVITMLKQILIDQMIYLLSFCVAIRRLGQHYGKPVFDASSFIFIWWSWFWELFSEWYCCHKAIATYRSSESILVWPSFLHRRTSDNSFHFGKISHTGMWDTCFFCLNSFHATVRLD